MNRDALRCGAAWLAAVVLGCAGGEPPAPATAPETGEVAEYSFGTIDGKLVTAEFLRGRVTVLLFITTFDLASQAQAKRLEDLSRQHNPRINALAVALEPPQNVELVRTFAQTVEIHYPVAMADSITLGGTGPWSAVRAVPTWVLLDKKGVIVSAFEGSMNPTELETWVGRAE